MHPHTVNVARFGGFSETYKQLISFRWMLDGEGSPTFELAWGILIILKPLTGEINHGKEYSEILPKVQGIKG